jgi:hypothetical protein
MLMLVYGYECGTSVNERTNDDDAVALQPRPGLGLRFGFHDSFIVVRCGIISSRIDLF